MYCNASKDSCNTFEARCNSTKDACIMQRIYIRRHFLYLRLKSVKELVNYNTRKTMKQKQKLKRWSGVLIALGVLGSSFTSCSSIKKGNDLPVVGKSVALFDYFNYKGEDDVYISNPLPGDDYFIIPFCRDGIPIPAFAPMVKVIIFWLFPPLLIIRVCLFPQQGLGELEAGGAYLESSFSISQHGGATRKWRDFCPGHILQPA